MPVTTNDMTMQDSYLNLYQQEGFNEEKMQSIAKYLNKLTNS